MGGTVTIAGVTLCWATATDIGVERSVNEDAALANPPFFVVADGMGGHRAGDVASSLVVDRFRTAGDQLAQVDEVVALLSGANTSILDEGRRSATLTGMGTTAVGLALVDNGDVSSWLVFNIGDSRVYHFADGALEQISVDHSYVQELVDAGHISAASARTHPQRNVVTRVLGGDERAEPDLWLRPPRVGERFLLCSDGLTSEVDDDVIARVMGTAEVDDAAKSLVALALAAGGHDNVTVMVVDVLDVVDDSLEITAPRDRVAGSDPSGPGDDQGPDTVEVAAVVVDGVEPQDEPIDGLIDRVPPQAELEADLAPEEVVGEDDAGESDTGLEADDSVAEADVAVAAAADETAAPDEGETDDDSGGEPAADDEGAEGSESSEGDEGVDP